LADRRQQPNVVVEPARANRAVATLRSDPTDGQQREQAYLRGAAPVGHEHDASRLICFRGKQRLGRLDLDLA
jgi:hypothetical protein